MPWFLFTLRPARPEMLTGGPTSEEAARVGEHFQYLVRLHAEGVVSLAGRTQDDGPQTVGLVVLRAETADQAAEILAADPAVRSGVFVGTVQPFGVAVGGWPEPQ